MVENDPIVGTVIAWSYVPTVLCAVHSVRNRLGLFPLLMLVFLPWVGSIVYLFVIYLPSKRWGSRVVRGNGENFIWGLTALACIVVLSLLLLKEYEFKRLAVEREGEVLDYGAEEHTGKGLSKWYVPWISVASTDHGSAPRQYCWIQGDEQVFGERESEEVAVRQRLEDLVKTRHIRYYVQTKDDGNWQDCRMTTRISVTSYWVFWSLSLIWLVLIIYKTYAGTRTENEQEMPEEQNEMASQ